VNIKPHKGNNSIPSKLIPIYVMCFIPNMMSEILLN